MKLRTKALIIIVVALLASIVVLYLASQVILLNSYLELEQQVTLRNVDRVRNTLEGEIASLSSVARDYSIWDDTYAFVEAPNDEEYISNNFPPETFSNFGWNLALIVNNRGEVVFGEAFNLESGEIEPIPERLASFEDAPADPLMSHADAESSAEGILLLPEGPMMIASRPILQSDSSGSIRGSLILGRYLNESAVAQLAETTRLNFLIHPLGEAGLDPGLEEVRTQIRPDGSPLVRPLDAETVAGYTVINDIYGQPALLVQVNVPREIYQQGERSIWYFLASLLAASLLFGICAMLLVERIVISRLSGLSARVSQISANVDPSMRVSATGNDELSSLAVAINRMLEALEDSQKMLRQREREATLLLDSLPAYAFFKDDKGAFVTANQKFCEAVGCPRDQIAGKTDFDFYPFELAEAYRAHDRRVMEVGEAVDVGEEDKIEGQRQVVVTTRKVPVKNDSGRVIGLIGLVYDVTDLKRAAEALALARDQAIDALRLKSQLLANVSHDLRTPINAILGYSEMLQEEVYGPLNEKQNGTLGRIIISTKQLSNLINNLLDQAQIEAGRLTLNKSGFTPASLLESIQAVMGVLAQSKGLELITQVDPGVPNVLVGDSQRLNQILLNLVGNAIKFTDQGSVKVRIFQPKDQQWAMEVSDTGGGIPPEAQTYIFDPFRQVDGSATRKHSGVGLGLAIVKQLATLMGGQVSLQSKLGQGSTFTISLPLETMEKELSSSARD